MNARGWAQTRIVVPPGDRHPLIASEMAGDGRTRLRIRLDRASPAAPIRGALSYPATWRAGRWSGEGVVTVMPQWSWGFELSFAVSPPASITGRILWPHRRLDRLANGLAKALREAAEAPQPHSARSGAASARTAAARRWSLDTAAGGSSSR